MNMIATDRPLAAWVAEVIGTFALVFAGTGAIIVNEATQGAVTHVGIALTFGLVVMAVIYSIGDISGAHINPAVTLGFWLAGRFASKDVMPFILSQLLGAFAASGLLRLLFLDQEGLGATLPSGTWWQSFVLELVLTFFLMFVIFNVASGAKENGVMAGAAIGGVVALEAMFAGPICGASMNPARSLAPAIVSGQWQYCWLYVLAPTLGAALAIPVCRCVRDGGCCRRATASQPETVCNAA